MKSKNLKILLASPRGFCAGVDRAIEIVKKSLDKYGKPVYVRHEIVHNKHVVDNLKKIGAIFVEELDEIEDKTRPVIFSAHGVPKSVPKEASNLNMKYVDATCPLVSKVHIETERHSKQGLQIIMVGHRGHPETIGTMGQLPAGEVILVETIEDVYSISPRDEKNLAYVTQTTLSIDDTKEIVTALMARFPNIVGPHKEDICYATTNRQNSVKAITDKIEGLLVVGSPNSSNSQRLVEVGEKAGCEYSRLIGSEKEINWDEIKGMKAIGITAGASAPEVMIEKVIKAFATRFSVELETVETSKENVSFKVPRILRELE